MMSDFPWEDYRGIADRATYDCADDKIRIYSGFVERPLWEKLRDLGFNRAPRQGCFFQVWNPDREDAALALCDGEILDEQSTLLERADERRERFTTYAENAAKRAARAREDGREILNPIPVGQPILVNHHSANKHQKDLERARRKAEIALEEIDRRDYWSRRGHASVRHALSKSERGKVLRRIKKLKADSRKHQASRDKHQAKVDLWDRVLSLDLENPEEMAEALRLSFFFDDIWLTASEIDPSLDNPSGQVMMSPRQAIKDGIAPIPTIAKFCKDLHERAIENHQRWIEHLEGQLHYWGIILESEHDINPDEQLPLKTGGWIRSSFGWAKIKRVNRGQDGISSVSIDEKNIRRTRIGGYFPRIIHYDRILQYQEDPPEGEEITIHPEPSYTKKKSDPLRDRIKEEKELIEKSEIKVNYNPGFFPTPDGIVDRMLDELGEILSRDGARLLEPGAGDGRIVIRALERFPGIIPGIYEINPTAWEVMRERGLEKWREGYDFLEAEPRAIYHAIAMNPTFNNRQGPKHVRHAFKFLEPGGILVAILPGSSSQYETPDSRDKFVRWILDNELILESVDLPDSSFSVKTHILILGKPEIKKKSQSWEGYSQGSFL